MVNGVSVENVTSAFAIQILKTCNKTANIVSGHRLGKLRSHNKPGGPVILEGAYIIPLVCFSGGAGNGTQDRTHGVCAPP